MHYATSTIWPRATSASKTAVPNTPVNGIKPYFPSRTADDSRVISGIIHVIRNGLRCRDAPEVYGPRKTLYNRSIRWSKVGQLIELALFTKRSQFFPEKSEYDRLSLE